MCPDILETAAIGVPPSGGGPERLVVAVVFKDSDKPQMDSSSMAKIFNSALQKKLNPLFKVQYIPSLQIHTNFILFFFLVLDMNF